MALFVKNHAVAFAHFTVPSGQCKRVATGLEEVVQKVLQECGDDDQDSFELVYTVGELSLILKLELRDLHAISRIKAELLRLGTLPVSWTFATPLRLHDQPLTTPLDSMLAERFLVYLRVNRNIFEKGRLSTQEKILRRIYRLAEMTPADIRIQSSAGLSWSDLALYGSFEGPQVQFLSFLLNLRLLKSDDQPIFQSSLTTFGFRLENGYPLPSKLDFDPAFLAKAAPGSDHSALQALQEFEQLTGKRFKISIVTGMADFLMVPMSGGRESKVPISEAFFEALEKPDNGLGVIEGHFFMGITKRLEKRLIANSKELTINDLPSIDHSFENADPVLARISELSQRLQIEIGGNFLLPRGLRESAQNVLSLLLNVHNATPHYSDSYASVNHLLDGLERALALLPEAYNNHLKEEANPKSTYAHFIQLRTAIRTWRSACWRILSDRRAGSHQELFRQADRFASHQGSVQKLSFLTDGLANEMLRQIWQDGMFDTLDSGLVTTFEPVHSVRSVPLLGIVQIPTRIKFSTGSMLHPLWHEVGQFIFDRVIVHNPVNYLDRIDEVSRESGIFLPGKAEGPALFTEIFSVMGDIFSDLIAFSRGFKGDDEFFLESLVSRYADLQLNDIISDRPIEEDWAVIGLRLYAVTLFNRSWEHQSRQKVFPPSIDSNSPSGQRVLFDLGYISLRIFEVLGSKRFAGSRLSRLNPERLLRNIYDAVAQGNIFYTLQALIQDALRFAPSRSVIHDELPIEKLQALNRGRCVDLDVADLPAYFLEAYREELDLRLRSDRKDPRWLNYDFAAALGNSAVMALHYPNGEL